MSVQGSTPRSTTTRSSRSSSSAVIKPKHRFKVIIFLVILSLSAYSYFAYNKNLFPFTKENKAKLNKLFKGKKEEGEDSGAIEDILSEEQQALEDELNAPSGGTGALGLDNSGSLNSPTAKGIESLYQQGLYRQLFEPFDRGGTGVGDLTKNPGQITVGGDVPPASVGSTLPAPYRYPFPVDERLYDMFGLYPPGGSYGDRTDPYSMVFPPYSSGSGKVPISIDTITKCNSCGPGMSWDSCTCRCQPEDAPRLMCYRPECACPAGDLSNDMIPDSGGGGGGSDTGSWWGRSGRDHRPRDEGTRHETADCPEGYMFDSCRCSCVRPGAPEIQCIRNCTQCPEGQWYSFCSNSCVSGRQKQCMPPIFEPEADIPNNVEVPDIPNWIPDEALAEIGQLRDVRDRLLQELDDLREELQDEIDELNAKLEEEKQKRQELEDLVEEIQDEVEEEISNNVPPQEREDNNRERDSILAEAEAIRRQIQDEIREIYDRVQTTNSTVTATAGQVSKVNSTIQSRINTYNSYRNSYTTSSTRTTTTATSGSGGTTATAGGGSATACAGGRCITAGQAQKLRSKRVRAMRGRQERNFAFSNLQHKARRMNTLKAPPTSFLKNKQFLNILPPIVARRHFATRIVQS